MDATLSSRSFKPPAVVDAIGNPKTAHFTDTTETAPGSSIGLVLLAMFTFCVGCYTGVSIFAQRCWSYGRFTQTAKLRYITPILLTTVAGIGFLGGGYWWIFAFAVAVISSRKGMARGWWAAVTFKACGLKGCDEMMSMGLFPTDEDALVAAIESVNKEIGKR
jgi:hypothetical protein